MRVSRWSRAPGQCEHVGDEVMRRYLDRTRTRKVKFRFLKIQKLVGLEVVWCVIG